ncbi:MAG: SAM-dependent methyltransferase [Gammaproteobacteria bacterium]|nr:MAG: SAM-dependent methyltransferase [Gammaproteobacteria bacterium]
MNISYAPEYDACVESGLYDRLTGANLLIPHTESDDAGMMPGKYRILMPEEIPYVSYPYEWSFSQLKDAALLTLEIQKTALESGLSLKDATAYNVQFHKGRPIFIDSLSFERYIEGEPWIAYGQFCQHFLAPLTLMTVSDLRLRQLGSRYIDGLPLDLVSGMLPISTYFNYSILAHIHLHARSQVKHQDAAKTQNTTAGSKLSKSMLASLITSMTRAVERLSVKDVPTEWGEYYLDTNYSEEAMQHKETILENFANNYLGPDKIVHDLGANTGRFSRIVAKHAKTVIAHDIDEMAVERHYRDIKSRGATNILPLILDLANPTPAIGWNLKERSSFPDRAKGTTGVALALVHHLCISNNVPLQKLAQFLFELFETLIIEFVPKEDSQVQRLLATRRDIFDEYDVAGFEQSFSRYFLIRERCAVNESSRIMYAMTRRV